MIRTARLEDCEALAQVNVTAWRESYSDILPEIAFAAMTVPIRRDQWRKRLEREKHLPVYIAEENGQAVGFADGGPARGEEALGQAMQIYSVYLLAGVKRRGLGTRLLQTVIKDFLAQGASSASVWTLRDAMSARLFYEHLGARLTAETIEHRPGYDRALVGYIWPDLRQVSLGSPSPLNPEGPP